MIIDMLQENKGNLQKEKSWRGKILNVFLRFVIIPLVRLIWVKNVEGRENLLKNGAYIIAANHQSYLDFICLAGVWPGRVYFLAAEKFFFSRFWRPLVEYTGQIRVDRDSKDKSASMLAAAEYLKEGKIIAIFPQGTRSRDGLIGKTYTGVAKLANMSGVPVVPVGIRGAFELLPPQKRLPKFSRGIQIYIGEPLSFTYDVNDEKNHRQATDQIMAKVAALAGLDYRPE
jgi:1-acyl-sn-glycerol-3-phosphate acyltransferase